MKNNKFDPTINQNKELEVLPNNKLPSEIDENLIINQKGIKLKKGGNIVIGTLNIFIKSIKSRNEKFYRNKKFHLFADIFLIALVLTLSMCLVYFLKLPKTTEDIIIKTRNLNPEIISGRIETFEIEYENKKNKDIEEVNLVLKLPENFILDNVLPLNNYNRNTNTFNLGDLSLGANGKVKISGTIWAEVGSQQSLKVLFNYKENNQRKSVFDSLYFIIEESSLRAEIEAPDIIYQGVEFSGKIKLENTALENLEEVNLIFPENMPLSRNQTKYKNKLLIGNIKPNEIKKISFNAIFLGGEGDNLIKIDSYIDFENKPIKQQALTKKILIKIPNFRLLLKADTKNIKINEKNKFLIYYKNNENKNISKLTIDFNFDNDNYLIEKIISIRTEKYEIIGNNIISFKDDLQPNQEENIYLEIIFKQKKTEPNQIISLIASVNYFIEDQKVNFLVYSPQLKILSLPEVTARAYYYSTQGDQLGVGPLPPIVGYKTNYWIFFEINNYSNEMKNFQLTAKLPKNVKFTGNKTLLTGKITADQSNNLFTWQIDEILNNNENHKSGIEIELTPRKEDIGKLTELLTDIKYTAYDKFCEQNIESSLNNLDTDLNFDKKAANKGKIRSIY